MVKCTEVFCQILRFVGIWRDQKFPTNFYFWDILGTFFERDKIDSYHPCPHPHPPSLAAQYCTKHLEFQDHQLQTLGFLTRGVLGGIFAEDEGSDITWIFEEVRING